MVRYQHLKVLTRLLHAQQHDNGLLCPIRRLKQVVKLKNSLVSFMREELVHASCVEVPYWSSSHHIHAGWSHEAKVNGCIHLLHKARLLASRLDSADTSQGAQQLLHDEFTREGQNNRIEGHEGNIPEALTIVRRRSVIERWLFVREENEMVDNIGLSRIDGI